MKLVHRILAYTLIWLEKLARWLGLRPKPSKHSSDND